MLQVQLLDAALLVCVIFMLVKLATRKNQLYPYPPGPKGLPLLGNVLDLPSEKNWEAYAKWGQKYGWCYLGCFACIHCSYARILGDLIFLTALGQKIVVINDLKTAFDMLDRKGTVYADRPQTAMLELAGWSRVLGCVLYGAQFREFRKVWFRTTVDGQGNNINAVLMLTAYSQSDRYQPISTEVPSRHRTPFHHVLKVSHRQASDD